MSDPIRNVGVQYKGGDPEWAREVERVLTELIAGQAETASQNAATQGGVQ